jgi:hypothetical protein
MPEWEFLARLAEAADCGLLLDVNNVHVSAFNHGFDPMAYIAAIPAERIVQVHLAGPSDFGTHLMDTHDAPVPDAVWPLYAEVQARTGGVSTLLEWDANIPRPGRPAGRAGQGGGRRGRAGCPSTAPRRPAPMAEPDLADLQRWMQGAILGRAAPPGLDASSSATPRAQGGLTAAQRLTLYARGYRARLMECLAAEFPCLRALAGEQVFELFAAGYIAERPSTDPSLYGLGAGFADYLEATRPAGDDGPGALSALPADLARLDRARAEVQRAVGVERLAGPAPAGRPAADARRAAAAARQRAAADLGFDPGPVLAAVDRGGPIDPPPPCPTPVAVARSRWRVTVHACRPGVMPGSRPWERRRGADVHAAAARAAQASGRDTGAVIADLTLWLPVAAAQGLVAVPTIDGGPATRRAPPRARPRRRPGRRSTNDDPPPRAAVRREAAASPWASRRRRRRPRPPSRPSRSPSDRGRSREGRAHGRSGRRTSQGH